MTELFAEQSKKLVILGTFYWSDDLRLPCSFRSCHFYGGVDKFLWLYLPILVLLLINTGMFIYVVFNICKTE